MGAPRIGRWGTDGSQAESYLHHPIFHVPIKGRIQNLWEEVAKHPNEHYEVSMKVDGTSITVYSLCNEKVGVCSRNFDLDYTTEENAANLYISVAREAKLLEVLLGVPRTVFGAARGAHGTRRPNANRDKPKSRTFFVFIVYHVDEKRFLCPVERLEVFQQVRARCVPGFVDHVPVLRHAVTLKEA